VGRIVLLGEAVAVEPFALAGAWVICVENPADVRRAWEELPSDTAVVVLSAAAAAALESAPARADAVLTVAMP